MKISAPWLHDQAAQRVCTLLTYAGYQAWFVGGCVRNTLIGVPVTDLDITTDAHPGQVVALAEAAGLKVVPTGIEHGTVSVIVEGRAHEVTTLRRDVQTDGRHAVVAFADDPAEDARRRDFTINALYAAPDGTLLDPLGGLADLEARRVRFIHDADARIREDYLRILRFFRFYAWYGDPAQGIDAEGLAACAANLDGIDQISRERVGAEMRKLLQAPDPAPAVAAMAAAGVLRAVLPGADSGHLAVLVHIEAKAQLQSAWLRRLAVLGGQDAAAVLRLSKAETAQLARLVAAMQSDAGADELGYLLGAQSAMDALALRAAFGGPLIDHEMLARTAAAAAQVCPLTAADLMPSLQGAALGEALRNAEARWVRSGFALTREALLAEILSPGGDRFISLR